MVLSDLTNTLASQFSITEAIPTLKPLLFFILGITIYAGFIFKFYKFVSRREIFKYDTKTNNPFFHTLFYIIKYLIIFPLFTFFWFLILAIILTFLSKQDLQTILLISMGLVGAIRVTSYLSEDLSKDLGKMLPFGLLGVFLVDISYFSVSNSLIAIQQIPSLWKIMSYYLILIILLEFILRIIFGILKLSFSKEKT